MLCLCALWSSANGNKQPCSDARRTLRYTDRAAGRPLTQRERCCRSGKDSDARNARYRCVDRSFSGFRSYVEKALLASVQARHRNDPSQMACERKSARLPEGSTKSRSKSDRDSAQVWLRRPRALQPGFQTGRWHVTRCLAQQDYPQRSGMRRRPIQRRTRSCPSSAHQRRGTRVQILERGTGSRAS